VSEQPGLFGAPAPATAPLSEVGLADAERRRVTRVIWSPIRLRTAIPCTECSQLQHESGGMWHRADARHRRTVTAPGAKHTLELCSRHAEVWRRRDVEAGLVRERQG
jgi:hypothetical protein